MFLLPCAKLIVEFLFFPIEHKEFSILPWREIPSFLIVSNPFLIINTFLALLNKMVYAVSLG